LQPTINLALIIGNEKYDNLQKEQPGKWANVKQAPYDVGNFKQFLKEKLHMKESDIIELHNAKRA